jgi:hypothetical protein
MPKQELERYFHWFMQVMPERLNELTAVVRSTPGYEDWRPDRTPDSLRELGRWLAGQVSVRSRTDEEVKKIEEGLIFPIEISGTELTARTLSLAMDVGMYLSDVLKTNHPNLNWDQPSTNKRFIDYGQPVLMKFKPGPFNPVRMVVTLAYGLAGHQKTADALKEIYDVWSRLIV